MFQPINPDIWTSGNRTVEDLVSRGGGLTWNPETQQWEKYWKEESYRDPETNQVVTFNPVLKRWLRVANSGVVRFGRQTARPTQEPTELTKPTGLSSFGLPADFMDYITGNYLTKG